MWKTEEQRVSIDAGATTKVRFICQEADRVLAQVGVMNGGPHLKIGDVVIGNVLWDHKPAPWPIAQFMTIELCNNGDGREVVVQAVTRNAKDDKSTAAYNPVTHTVPSVKEQSPAEVDHVIRIRIRKDGTVDGDLDGDGAPIYPRGDQTTDGQCMSVLQEALMRILSAHFAARKEET